MWDASCDGKDTQNQNPRWIGNVLATVIMFAFKIAYRYKVENVGMLRAFKSKRGCVVVSNHTSFLDVMFIYISSRLSQWIRFMGKDSLWKKGSGALGVCLSNVGAFPVTRSTADTTSIKRAVRMLKNQELVGIMPEGTRRGKGDVESSIHSGAALIARMANVPILPVGVCNVDRIKVKGERLRFPKVKVVYGNPVLVSDFDFLPKADRLDACSWFVLRECFALQKECEPKDIDMKTLFPDCKDFAEVFRKSTIPVRTSQECISVLEDKRPA